jgi:hypothetical protein
MRSSFAALWLSAREVRKAKKKFMFCIFQAAENLSKLYFVHF